MLIVAYLLLLPGCSFIVGLLGFFIGRCARPLPIIDRHMPQILTYVKPGNQPTVRGGSGEVPFQQLHLPADLGRVAVLGAIGSSGPVSTRTARPRRGRPAVR
jgi:hypothetical protein